MNDSHLRSVVDGQDVTGADDAAAAGAARPMHHGPAGEMSAAAHQRNAIPKRERVAFPQLDRAGSLRMIQSWSAALRWIGQSKACAHSTIVV